MDYANITITAQRAIPDPSAPSGYRNYIEGYCASTTPKPTEGIADGSKLTETDTGDLYLYVASAGAWAFYKNLKGEGGGGGGDDSNIFLLQLEVDEEIEPPEGADVAIKSKQTAAEVLAAVAAGKTVLAAVNVGFPDRQNSTIFSICELQQGQTPGSLNVYGTVASMVSVDSMGAYYFSLIGSGDNILTGGVSEVAYEPPTPTPTPTESDVFVVNFGFDQETGNTADKTYAEVLAAHQAGKIISARYTDSNAVTTVFGDYNYNQTVGFRFSATIFGTAGLGAQSIVADQTTVTYTPNGAVNIYTNEIECAIYEENQE